MKIVLVDNILIGKLIQHELNGTSIVRINDINMIVDTSKVLPLLLSWEDVAMNADTVYEYFTNRRCLGPLKNIFNNCLPEILNRIIIMYNISEQDIPAHITTAYYICVNAIRQLNVDGYVGYKR